MLVKSSINQIWGCLFDINEGCLNDEIEKKIKNNEKFEEWNWKDDGEKQKPPRAFYDY